MTSLGSLVPVAPYEVYASFSINERNKKVGAGLSRSGDEKKWRKELGVFFDKWKVSNYGHVLIPLIADVVGWSGVVSDDRVKREEDCSRLANTVFRGMVMRDLLAQAGCVRLVQL